MEKERFLIFTMKNAKNVMEVELFIIMIIAIDIFVKNVKEQDITNKLSYIEIKK